MTSVEGGPVTGFAVSVRLECAVCGEPFVWIGPPLGLNARTPTVSIDRCELRAPARPASFPLGWGEDLPGVSVRFTGGSEAPSEN